MKRICLPCVLVAAFAVQAVAQTYPTRNVTLIVPFAAGGSVDVMARIVAAKLSDSLGKPVMVENRGGGGGAIGMNAVAKAEPDGYTLLYTPNTLAINPAFYRKLPFNAEKDFRPISQVLMSTLVLVVNPKVVAKNLSELVAKAKAQPGKLNFGSVGVADTFHLGIEMLKVNMGIDVQPIPYKGQGPMLAALLAGEIDMAILSIQVARPSIESGMLTPIAVTHSKRSPALPNVPTMGESGATGYELTSWQGLFAPSGTPGEIIDRLSKEVVRAVNDPDVRHRIESIGDQVVASSPEIFEESFRDTIMRFKRIAKEVGIPYQD